MEMKKKLELIKIKLQNDANLKPQEKNKKILKLVDIKKHFSMGETSVKAINGISLTIKEGEFVAVLGASGSGKSTLLSLIAGLLHPTDGKILLNEKNIVNLPENDLADIRRNEIGLIFQFFHLNDTLTSVKNIELPLLIAGMSPVKRRKKALSLLKLVGLSNRESHFPHELSGGEKQRIGIARALAINPLVLLADEPTGDLDSTTSEGIIDHLVSINQSQGVTVIMVTHDEEALRNGMRVLLIGDGQIKDDFIYAKK